MKSIDLRKAQLAAIHVGKAKLGLDDDTYRSMLWTVARVHSAADADERGRKLILDHMRARGFRPLSGQPRSDNQVDMIRRLWAELHRAGKVKYDTERAINQWVHRQIGVAALQWATAAQKVQLIEGLKRWITRS